MVRPPLGAFTKKKTQSLEDCALENLLQVMKNSDFSGLKIANLLFIND